jgi:hypothetical protein
MGVAKVRYVPVGHMPGAGWAIWPVPVGHMPGAGWAIWPAPVGHLPGAVITPFKVCR